VSDRARLRGEAGGGTEPCCSLASGRWAKCEYLATLPDLRSMTWTSRFEAEGWVTMAANWAPATCLQARGYNQGHLRPEDYVGHVGCGWLVPLSDPLFEGGGVNWASASA
jgi:hypothetical protein